MRVQILHKFKTPPNASTTKMRKDTKTFAVCSIALNVLNIPKDRIHPLHTAHRIWFITWVSSTVNVRMAYSLRSCIYTRCNWCNMYNHCVSNHSDSPSKSTLFFFGFRLRHASITHSSLCRSSVRWFVGLSFSTHSMLMEKRVFSVFNCVRTAKYLNEQCRPYTHAEYQIPNWKC